MHNNINLNLLSNTQICFDFILHFSSASQLLRDGIKYANLNKVVHLVEDL